MATARPGEALSGEVEDYVLGSLGSRLWRDDGAGTVDGNNNGRQDGIEAGRDGATVELYRDTNGDGLPDGPAIATTLTSGGGNYRFNGPD